MSPTFRRLGTVLGTIATLMVIAVPAFAASEDSPAAGGAGGLVMALILGVLVGLVIFIDVFTAGEPDPMPAPPREH